MIRNTDLRAESLTSFQKMVSNTTHIQEHFAGQVNQIFHLLISGPETVKTPTFIRIEIPIPPVDSLSWLQRQSFVPKTYWEDRDKTLVMAGVGVADLVLSKNSKNLQQLFACMRQNLSVQFPNMRYYGGLRFCPPRTDDPSWQPFGQYQFILPQFEVFKSAGQSYFAGNFLIDARKNLYRQQEKIQKALREITFVKNTESLSMPNLLSRQDLPDKKRWTQNIYKALQAFSKGEMDKVVLARKSIFTFEEALDALLLLRRLKASNPQLFYYCFQPDQGHAFIGGSPERLYKRGGHQVKSEAIAGTRPRGQTLEEDQRLARELITSDKDIREHRFVLDTIRKTLDNLCHTVDIDDEISLLKLSRVQHLCCRLQGILSEHITDAQILQALHPTPAVGGFPTAKAIQAIQELEPFDRGWYAGPIGWISANAAEFVVAIRSGLIHENQLSLFSGAGIVEGSTPDGEWEEIENKIANFMKVLSTPC